MLRAANALVTLNRIAGRKPDSTRKIEEFLARDLEVTAPLAIQVAIEEGEPMGRALANVLKKRADPDLAMRLYPQLPVRSVELQDAAIIVTEQIASAVQERPGICVTSVAATKISFAYRLSEAGQHERAVSELQHAVDSLEQLYQENSLAAGQLLAQAQHIYSEILKELGRHDEAEYAERRANELHEALETRSPGSQLVELATSWQVFTMMQAGAGQQQEWLEPTFKAIPQRDAMPETDLELSNDVAN
jgi:tetratricopeptide (TPR) repeat protein